jgi:hypothetical protein
MFYGFKLRTCMFFISRNEDKKGSYELYSANDSFIRGCKNVLRSYLKTLKYTDMPSLLAENEEENSVQPLTWRPYSLENVYFSKHEHVFYSVSDDYKLAAIALLDKERCYVGKIESMKDIFRKNLALSICNLEDFSLENWNTYVCDDFAIRICPHQQKDKRYLVSIDNKISSYSEERLISFYDDQEKIPYFLYKKCKDKSKWKDIQVDIWNYNVLSMSETQTYYIDKRSKGLQRECIFYDEKKEEFTDAILSNFEIIERLMKTGFQCFPKYLFLEEDEDIQNKFLKVSHWHVDALPGYIFMQAEEDKFLYFPPIYSWEDMYIVRQETLDDIEDSIQKQLGMKIFNKEVLQLRFMQNEKRFARVGLSAIYVDLENVADEEQLYCMNLESEELHWEWKDLHNIYEIRDRRKYFRMKKFLIGIEEKKESDFLFVLIPYEKPTCFTYLANAKIMNCESFKEFCNKNFKLKSKAQLFLFLLE